MRPKVLHLIDSFEQGGTERQAIQLVRLLRTGGHCQVHLACLQNKGSLRGEVESMNIGQITEYPLNSFYDLNFLRQLRRLARFLKEKKIDVVHTHDFYTNIFGMNAAMIARVPARVASKRETNGFRTPLQKRAERMAFRMAHRVVANSEAVRRQLISEGVRRKKVVTLYNGLDLERLDLPTDLKREDALARFGLPGERRFVTIVANLNHAVKDHPTFLRAAAQVHRLIPDAAFIIAGEGELKPSLHQLAQQLGIDRHVFFLGRCDQVAELLFASDVCVLSSTAEGFSNAILEYMAAARPVVATDVGGAREAIVDGETGYLVAAGNDQEMAERIAQLLREPGRAHQMGQRGKQRVLDEFSTSRQLDNTLRLYATLLRRKSTSEDFEIPTNVTGPRAMAGGS